MYKDPLVFKATENNKIVETTIILSFRTFLLVNWVNSIIA